MSYWFRACWRHLGGHRRYRQSGRCLISNQSSVGTQARLGTDTLVKVTWTVPKTVVISLLCFLLKQRMHTAMNFVVETSVDSSTMREYMDVPTSLISLLRLSGAKTFSVSFGQFVRCSLNFYSLDPFPKRFKISPRWFVTFNRTVQDQKDSQLHSGSDIPEAFSWLKAGEILSVRGFTISSAKKEDD